MRRHLWLLPVLIGLAGIAGCDGDEPTATTTTSPTASVRKPTPTATVTPTPSIIGNGVAQLAPAEVLVRAKQATIGVTSVRMRGRMRIDGELMGMDIRTQGPNAAGRMDLEGHRADVVVIGSAFYFKPSKAFLEENGGRQAVDAFYGKWFKTRIDDKEIAEFVSVTSMSSILAEFPDTGEAIYARKGTPTKINGVPAIPVGDEMGTDVYVATEGRPYLLRMRVDKGKEYVDFLEHGKPVTIQRPPSRLVVDIDEFS